MDCGGYLIQIVSEEMCGAVGQSVSVGTGVGVGIGVGMGMGMGTAVLPIIISLLVVWLVELVVIAVQ